MMIHPGFKGKLFIGFGFLLVMILLLWLTGSFFIYDLSGRSSAMLKENYQTVESTKFLIQELDEIKNDQLAVLFQSWKQETEDNYRNHLKVFSAHLAAVRNNITEKGEAGIIQQLETSYLDYIARFDSLSAAPGASSADFLYLTKAYRNTRDQIIALWDLNMAAISQKNNRIRDISHKAFVIMSVIGSLCFILSALFFFRYPAYISRPITLLIQGIREIANRNYGKRLQFSSHDEFGELALAFNQMAAKMDEYEHSNLSQLLFEKKRINTIINIMNDAVIGLDEAKFVIFANAAAGEILRTEPSTLTGKSASELSSRNEACSKVFEDIEEGGKQPKEFHPIKIIRDGKPVYFAREVLEVAPTKTGGQLPVNTGSVIIMKNITHFLEESEAKTNFIATISHELKTPISSLRLNLKLLDDPRIGELNREQKEIIAALKEETLKMSGITAELLDLAQVETGHVLLNFQAVAPHEIISYIKNPALNLARSRDIRINFFVPESLPEIWCDSEKTAWVLLNMVNNAILYSPEGSEVDINVSKKGASVQFMVRDNGIGIEEQYLQQIFEKYFRVPGSDQKGSGLGLAISKEFISKQQGNIWVESMPGKGSNFYFDLPVHRMYNRSF